MIVNQQSLRGIYVGFNTLFNKAFEEVAPLYTEVATVTPSTTDSETYAWLGDIPGMREWIGDREIQNLTASDYTIKNKDFELTVGVDRNAIEDDKIGLYNPSVQMLGQSAAAHPDELIFALLAGGFSEKCYDGQPFFSDAHKIGKKTVTNKSTGAVTFAVGPTGLITINGQVTMGAGSTINWAQVNNQNLHSNPAYSLANNAYNLADDAYYEAELAYDRANRAYKLADSIEMPGYIKSTYIDQTTIRSPVIEGGEFYGEEFNIIAGSDFGSFNLYGPFGSSRYHMLAIEYFEGDAPLINIYSPCGGYITIGQRRNGIVYFEGIVDFSAADVQGLDLGTGA